MEDLLHQARGVQDTSDTDANLRKLSELRDAGVLTDDEFEAKKAQLQSHT